MGLTQVEKRNIKEVIATSLQAKFATYEPNTKTVMPFHTRLLGQDRMALFSFIQSLNTTFGTSIYEPVAEAIAKSNFTEVTRGRKSNGKISAEAQKVINDIKNSLERAADEPSQRTEMERIRKVCQKGETIRINIRQADIYLISKDNWHYPIDIKTVKPNIDGFEKYKENILKWTASILYTDPMAQVGGMLAIPYNPYYPEQYKHWTMRGMIEKNTQIKVAGEFWDFLGGKPIYSDLLDCFEEVGIEMRNEIDIYFARFRST